jgi:hypothetical protein
MKQWEKKEKKDKKDFQTTKHKGSGNYWAKPGDSSNSTLLIESKQTSKKSYSISKQTWDKLYEEALFAYRIPVLSILIQNLELVVLSKEDFMRLTQKKS